MQQRLSLAIVAAVLMVLAIAFVAAWRHGRTPASPGEPRVEDEALAVVAAAQRSGELPSEPRRPSQEDTRESPEGTPIVVEVVHCTQTPAAGASVIVLAGGHVLSVERTDASGRASVTVPDTGAELVVWGASWEECRRNVSRDDALVRIELPAGEMVSGWVFLAGEPPDERIRLSLDSSAGESTSSEWVWDLPPQARSALDGAEPMQQLTTVDGQFVFSGLPRGWAGSVTFPDVYELEHEPPTIHAPATGIVLRLRYRPAITGRAVDGLDEPVAHAKVYVTIVVESKEPLESHGQASADGRFRIPIRHPRRVQRDSDDRRMRFVDMVLDDADGRAESLTLEVVDPLGRELQTVRMEDVDLSAGLDVGDVQLDQARVVAFEVTDLDARPVSRAFAVGGIQYRIETKPTGADGRGTIHGLGQRTEELLFLAPGFACTTVQVAAENVGTLKVAMRKAAVLDIRTVRTSEPPLGDEQVSVGIKLNADSLFRGGHADPKVERLRERLGLGEENGRKWQSRTVQTEVFYVPNDEGRVLVNDVATGVEIVVQAYDASRTPIGAATTVVLAEAEHKLVPLERP